MKRFLAFALSSVMITSSVTLGSIPSAVNAAGVDAVPISAVVDSMASKSGKASEPTKEALESVIKAVKAKITIPKEYSEFNYNFRNTVSFDGFEWNLSWRNPKDDSYIQVSADQNNRIQYYEKYNYSDTNSIPKYLKKELQSTAEQFLKKIAPEVALKVTYKDADYEGIYSGNYVYNFERNENGVSFPDNTVSVGVNSVTGEVQHASIGWIYDTKVPSSEVKVTKEEAEKLIKENMKMKLIYRSNYNRIFAEDGSKLKKEAYLVYTPSEDYISIDAKTGKVYLSKVEWQENNYSVKSKQNMDEAAAITGDSGAGSISFTEDEIKKMEELKNLISKEDAIKKVTSNKYLYLDKNLEVYSATLNKSYNGDGETYVWNITLNDPREIDYKKETDYYRAYASAQVDAKTGKIVYFNASMNNYYDEVKGKWNTVSIKYNKEQAKEILEKFLKAENSSRFSKSKLASESDDFVAYLRKDTPVYSGYSYQYNRVNDGIEYPNNSIHGSVDGISGKVYSYGYYWENDVVFESPKGAMSAEKAMEHYLSKDGYGLKYEINVVNTDNAKNTTNNNASYSSVNEIRLVYRPDINPAFLSPFTGEQLTNSGEAYKEAKAFVYKDVPETAENKEILLLADMNIGFEGEYFYPEKAITIGEIASLFEEIGYGYPDDDTKKTDPKLITKEELTQRFINELGMEKVAKLPGIYQTGYADESSINPEYLGAVALAKGLAIIEADSGNNFNPKANVTRAEAVHYILKFLEVRREGIYR